MDIKKQTDDFLHQYGMHYDTLDFHKVVDDFVQEMDKGLTAAGSSLPMIPTYISGEEICFRDKKIITLDAGGTNLRVALVGFYQDGKADIEYFKNYSIPGLDREITKDDFFLTLAEYLKPIHDKSDAVAISFSYPAEILPSRDGRIIEFGKEVKVTGAEGALVGEELLKAMAEKGLTHDKQVVVLNDTVSTLLGGRTVHPLQPYSGFIGFILGTGTNTCYDEENSRIYKADALNGKPGSTYINMESASFNLTPAGVIDDLFDATTVAPGKARFEKMISGAYQGALCQKLIEKAAEDGFFSDLSAGKIKELSTKDVHDFCSAPYGGNPIAGMAVNDNDRLKLYYLAEAIVERAAKLTAVNLAAVMKKMQRGKNPLKPICIAAEGSTLQKSEVFKPILLYYMKQHIQNEMGYYYQFVSKEQLNLLGTAMAGFLTEE